LVGEIWQLRFGKETGNYQKAGNRCIESLAKVLVAPNRLFTVAELMGDSEGKLAGDALLCGECETDRDGLTRIKNRLEEIEEIDNDIGGSEALDEEKAYLLQQVQQADENKQITSPLKKAHHNLATQLRTFIAKLSKTGMPFLAAHLKTCLKLDFPHAGYFPPPDSSSWKS
jgi:hypothetical protein